jgi:hypothetical protein
MIKVRSDLPKWLVDNGLLVGAEIGVYKGEFTEMFCLAGVKMIYAIDAWKAYWSAETDFVTQERQDFLCGHSHRVLDKYSNCTIVRKESMEALADFQDESLDFVYIDGDHSFKYVACDIYEWAKKVKRGGVVSGHDYTSLPIYGSQVKPVVDAYVQAFNIKTFQELGSTSKSDLKQRGDRYHSWMFTK